MPSQRQHPAPHTCPTLWHNGQSSSDISENSILQDHPVTWELADSLSFQLCGVDFTCPAAHCPQCPQSSTAFKQEPRRPPVNHLAHPPQPQHNGLRTAHTFSTFSTPFTAPASSTPPAFTHSQASCVPKAALRDHGSTSPPVGSAADLQQVQPGQGAAGTVSPGGLSSGGSRPRIFRVMELTDLTAFCLWFALHIPSYTLCQCQAIRIPLQPGICSHNQGKKAVWRVHRIHGEAGAPPHRGFAHSASPRGRGQPGEWCTQEFWVATVQMQGPGFCSLERGAAMVSS